MIEIVNSGIEWLNWLGTVHWSFALAMFVQTLLLVAVLGVLEFTLRRRLRAVVRYWIWSLVLLKLMLPVTLSTPASIGYWLVQAPPVVPAALPTPQSEPAPMPPEVPVAVMSISPRTRPTAPKTEPVVGQAESWLSSPTPRPRKDNVELEVRPSATAAAPSVPLPKLHIHRWLFLAWLAGLALLGAIVARRIVKVWQLVRRATEAPADLDAPLRAACDRLRVSARRIRLRISDEVGCPAICGFWRPTIVLPRRLLGQLDDEQLELVFAHEASHWKRRDLQIHLLQTVLQVVYFYNPAVWIANAVLRRLREEAVDDEVLVGSATRCERYSNTLLDVAAQSIATPNVSLRLIGILESRMTLAQRIRRLASGTLPKSARLGVWGFLVVVVIGLVLLPMAGRRVIAQKPARDPAPVKKDATKDQAPGVALSGLITNENGEPVSDAAIHLAARDLHRQTRPPATKRAITVADLIETTRLADQKYFSGHSAEGRVAQFSPDSKQFVILLRKGNIRHNTNEYSLFLFRTAAALGTPQPDLLLTMASWLSNRRSMRFHSASRRRNSRLRVSVNAAEKQSVR
jgi:beta-lactamase regulating signal transducer with metallopeptidase domain